jgi:glycosyltransferase involved in cell wall biosynthesis
MKEFNFTDKKVLFITLDFPNIDRRILMFARWLKEEGAAVSILCPDSVEYEDMQDINFIRLIEESPKIKGVARIKKYIEKHLPNAFLNLAKKLYRKIFTKDGITHFEKEMMEAVEKCNADLFVSNDLLTLAIGVHAKNFWGGKLLYDAHEFYTEQIFLSAEQKKVLKKLENDNINMADLVMTINSDIAKLFENTYGCECAVIQNIVERTNDSVKSLHELMNIERSKKILLFQGGLIKYRNLDRIIEMGKYLKNSVLVVIGDGELKKELEKQASSYGDKVFFVDRIPLDVLLSYCGSADIGLIPYPAIDLNTKFCSPNKLYEFTSSGLPVAVNRELVTASRIVAEKEMGFPVDFSKPDEAAWTIENKLNDDDYLAKLREAVKRNITDFLPETVRPQYIELVALVTESNITND